MSIYGYDTETTGVEPYMGDSMFMYSISDYAGNSKAYRVDGAKVRELLNQEKLEKFWCDPQKDITCHNVKFDLTFTEKLLGKEFKGKFHCTLAMAWLLMNLYPNHGLKHLCKLLADIPTNDEEAIQGYGSYQYVPEKLMDKYASLDAFRHVVLFRIFWPDIIKDPGTLEAYNTEMSLIRPLIEIERRGLRINPAAAKKLMFDLSRDVGRLERELHYRAGRVFNPDSSIQLSNVLFNKLGLPVLERTPTGQPTTAKGVLEELRVDYPIVNTLMKYRSFKRAIPIIQSYVDYADSDDVIHPNFKPTGAITGRMSCENPNLQNVQRKDVLRNPYPIPARSVFIARKGYTNYHFDWKGQEIRMLTQLTHDPEYTRLLREDKDPHGDGTAMSFYPPEKARIKKFRDAAKNTTFAIHYGAGESAMAKTLMISLDELKRRLPGYEERFPRARVLIKEMSQQVKEIGYVRTVFDRKIMVNPEKPYSAPNAAVQGGGADMIKRSAPRVHNLFKQMDNGCHVLLLVHDELFTEIPDRLSSRQRNEVLVETARIMEDFPRFDIPVKVDCKRSKVWSEKESVILKGV